MNINNLFNNRTTESVLFVRRVLISCILMLLLTSIVIINLYDLQIIHYEKYKIRSKENYIKIIPTAPNRGNIYDRNGIPLALNNTIYQLEIIPKNLDQIQKKIEALNNVIKLNEIDLASFQKKCSRYKNLNAILLKTNLSDRDMARFSVNQHQFSDIEIKEYRRRYYPYGPTLTHVIGYVSKIDNKDKERLYKNGKISDYAASHDIGKLGIERYYEDILHGKPGYQEVEVNNKGQVIRLTKTILPKSGHDIYLTIDIKLQQYIEKLLTGSRAAVVVTDPRNGDILALVSMPSYNPNLFIDGISNKEYSSLLKDQNMPLLNRAIQGMYPPASTVKPYVAISALSTGIITFNTYLFDPGWWKLPGSEKYYRDWKKWGHGHLNITKSLEESSDTFFYQIAYDMGIDRLSKWMNKFGYGHHTGIDILEEYTGNMPTKAWKLKRFNKPWYYGDTISVGIGQGYWSATPLQMNKALMILINNGNIKIPHLLMSSMKNGNKTLWTPPKKSMIDNIHPSYWGIVKDGMYGVAHRPNGTAHQYFSSAPYKIAAKSGTAQLFNLKSNESYKESKIAEHLRDHKLMIAFAPYKNPTVAISMILENGGSGTQKVGSLTRKILDHLILNQKKSILHNSR